jgi:hypothetical protein
LPTDYPIDIDLALVIDHWEALSSAVRAGIVAMVQASMGMGGRRNSDPSPKNPKRPKSPKNSG